MKISPTLSAYLARAYVKNMLLMLLGLLVVIYLFDEIELIRRTSKIASVPMLFTLKMALLKLPKDGQTLFPFAILYSAMFTFWQLTRRYELVVVRAAGFSFWQFLAPIILVALGAGVLQMTVINPLGSVMVAKYDQMERKYFAGNSTEIALFKEGLWLKQETNDGYAIIYSPKVQQRSWVLQSPMVLFFNKDDGFTRRIDADTARLEQGQWVFENVIVGDAKGAAKKDTYTLSTTLTRGDVEESFSSPNALSFWRMPAHIQTLDETGFDSTRLRVYYQNLLAQPLLFAAMILLAAAVSLRPPRTHGGLLLLLVIGVLIGFVVFFLSTFLQALGSTQQIPVILAAWSPAVVSCLLGLSVMMNLEDG